MPSDIKEWGTTYGQYLGNELNMFSNKKLYEIISYIERNDTTDFEKKVRGKVRRGILAKEKYGIMEPIQQAYEFITSNVHSIKEKENYEDIVEENKKAANSIVPFTKIKQTVMVARFIAKAPF